MDRSPASMTGSGSASLDLADRGRFDAEVRAVNHRFLKTSIRSHGPLPPLDGQVESKVKERVARGHVSVFVRYTPSVGAGLGLVDETAFGAGAHRLKQLAQAHGLRDPGLGDVLRLPGVLGDPRHAAPTEAATEGALQAVDRALEAFDAARRREGAHLTAEVRGLLDAIQAGLDRIRGRAAEVPDALRSRLEARMRELLEGTGVSPDPAQIVREAALLADRADVQEEIARLEAHLAHAREVLSEGGPVGRKLDFLVQEMHRETNTIGSKAGELDLSRRVVEMKSDVERLREQVQNLE